MRTLVLGTAFRYGLEQVWVFVESLRRNYEGEVALLVSAAAPAEFISYLTSRRVTPVLFDCASWMLPPVEFSRFVRYGEFLRSRSTRYDRVLLTDVADVVFQTDPFASAPGGDLLLFMESRTISSCPRHAAAISDVYGPEMVARIGSCEICCAGTTMGTHAAILNYCDRLVSQVQPDRFVKLHDRRGHHQGIHNVLLHTGALSLARRVPNGFHVFTVGSLPDDQVITHRGLIRPAALAALPAIIHQYNRKPAVAAVVAELYPFSPSVSSSRIW